MATRTTDWFATLRGFHEQAWKRLARGVVDRNAAARHPTLATVGLDGGAEARTVVLREVDPSAGSLELHTDSDSAKVAELRRNPSAALHVWDPRPRLQIRMRVIVRCSQGDDAASRWQQVPARSRWSYGGAPGPGRPLDDVDGYRPAVDFDRFMILHCTVQGMDLLHLGEAGHRRALFERDDGFQGCWLAP